MDEVVLITDGHVRELEGVGRLSAKGLNDVVERAYTARGAGESSDTIRQHVWVPDLSDDATETARANEYFRAPGSRGSLKSYTSGSQSYGVGANLITVGFSPGTYDLWTVLFSPDTGRLKALVEGGRFSALKTGAVAGVAVRHLAAQGEITVALVGTGKVGAAALEQLAAERPIRRVFAHRRDRAALDRFCAWATERLGVEVDPVDDLADAVGEADVTVVATNARQPAVLGRWLKPQSLTISMGTHYPTIREVDSDTVLTSTLIVDSIEQAQAEKGDFLLALDDDPTLLERVLELPDLLQRDRSEALTFDNRVTFMSCGLGTETVACADYVIRQAEEAGLGHKVPL